MPSAEWRRWRSWKTSSFDGVTLTRFLRPLCLYNLAIAPDGSIWALAGANHWEEKDAPVDTYVIPAEVAIADR